MPIICFGFKPTEVPEGAVNVQASHHGAGYYGGYDIETGKTMPDKQGPTALYTWDTHTGLCLEDREFSERDDSDFYMIVWNPEAQKPERITFASTRGWSYPSYGSKPCATPEVRAAYAAYLRRREDAARAKARQDRICAAWSRRQSLRAAAARLGFPYANIIRLQNAIGREDVDLVAALFSPRLRSAFKLSMQAQVVRWLQDAAPKHRSPLSPKQMSYL